MFSNSEENYMKLLIILVQYGKDKYPDSVNNFSMLIKQQLPQCEFQVLVVDNKIENEFHECIDNIQYIGGDNTCWEFSAWDKAIELLGDQVCNFDFVGFTTSALFALDTSHIHEITMEKLSKAKAVSAVCGKIDSTSETLAINGENFNRWIRTSLFFVPPEKLVSLGNLTTYTNIDTLFTENPDVPFADFDFLNDEIKAKILFWLTCPESTYHSKFTLDNGNFSFFKAKTLAILNEYALTLRLLAAHIPVIDLSSTDSTPETLHIVSPVIDFECYDRLIRNNATLQDERIVLVPVDNTQSNIGISEIYNSVVDSFIKQARGWLCFCHQDLQFFENPLDKCHALDKHTLYGVAGGRLVQNGNGEYVQEFVCKILQPGQDGITLELLGADFPDNATVDALDCVMLLVHSDLFLETSLRFDENLKIHQYVDEFCLRARKQYKIKSKVLDLRCFHESNAALSIKGDYFNDVEYVQEKYKDVRAAGNCAVYGCSEQYLKSHCAVRKANRPICDIYKQQVKFDKANTNVPVVLAIDFITENSCILDVGCSCGDCGSFLKEHRNALLWGFEYDRDSIQIARKKQIYEDIVQVDLNTFTTYSFPQYYRFFDTIFCGDVLEHLYEPLDVLVKLKSFIKHDGSLIVSIPNIMHMNVVLGLMGNNFHQSDSGILDKTHIRFFTRKSLALLFTQASLETINASVTFMAPEEMGNFALPKTLSPDVYSTFTEDLHYFVLQYVCQLKHSELQHEELFTKNSQMLLTSVLNNPKSLEKRHAAFCAVLKYSDDVFDEAAWKGQLKTATEYNDVGNAILESRLFDINWYMVNYPCAEYEGRHPLVHYVERGWTLGWNPSEQFDTLWYLNEYPDVLASGQCPLLHYVSQGIFEGRHISERAKQKYEKENRYYKPSDDDLQEKSSMYLPITETPFSCATDTRLIAFYLPQYYPFELNNTHWGEGFTDWRNVASAKPLFDGHYQPHIPIDIGHYDLRLEDNALRQFELAKMYGVHAFCYYYYWFDGNRLMDMPVYRHLANRHFDFPYCLCWTPETWRTTWHTTESIVMLEQPPTIDTKRFFFDLYPFLQDERYIRVNGKPLLMIYHPTFFKKSVLIQFFETLRELSQKHGVGDLHVVFAKSYVQQAKYTTPEDLGGDAFADFPPHGVTFPLDKAVKFYDQSRIGTHHVFDMRTVVEKMRERPHYDYTHYPTVMPMWDNTARSVSSRSWTFVHSSPELYQEWLESSIRYVASYKSCDEHLVFINAWNEWAEGAHLEPDKRYGYAFLNATRRALENTQMSMKI